MSLDNTIRDYRKAEGMTQQALADLVGCRRETIANLEAGRYNPSLELIDKIAGVFRVTIYDIMTGLESGIAYSYELKSARVEGKNSAFDAIMRTSCALSAEYDV